MKYSKEMIEEKLKELLNECLHDFGQEDGFIDLVYDEKTQTCDIKMSVHVEEEDDYVGFSSY